jgi:UDP-glucuronate decarboxylase
MTIQWITPLLGTASASEALDVLGVEIIDVRELVDRSGNNAQSIHDKINSGVQSLMAGKKTIICCDHGISRSNSIAAGILASTEQISIDAAVGKVIEATGETEIQLGIIESIRNVVESGKELHHLQDVWLLIGASGYLGSLLVGKIPKTIKLLTPSKEELNLLNGSVAIDLFVRKHQVSRIIHCAAPRIKNINSSLGESLTMLRNILEVCAVNKLSFFYPSRWEIYAGYFQQNLVVSEETEMRPFGILGDTHYLCEMLIQSWVNRGLEQVTVLRSGLIFGLDSAPNFMLSFIKRVVSGEKLITHLYKNGAPKLDLIYASDWAEASWRLLLSRNYGIYSVGGGALLSTREIADVITNACGGIKMPESIQVEGFSSNILFDSKKLSMILGWKSGHDVIHELKKYAKHYANKIVAIKTGN